MRVTFVCPLSLVASANAAMTAAGVEGEVFNPEGGWLRGTEVVSVASGIFATIPAMPVGVAHVVGADVPAALAEMGVVAIDLA